MLIACFWAICLSLIWFSIGDHPLSPHSEARYAVVSRHMADGAGWLVPRRAELVLDAPLRPHLTKPPLTYWLQAGCMRILGVNEFAARAPCAVAGSLTLLAVFAYCWPRDTRLAMLATGTLALSPLHLVLSRNTLTDAILALFWFGTLAAGSMTVREPGRKRWPALLWISVALGLLTKGPIAYMPLGLLVLWLAVSQRRREIRSLRLPLGLAVSAIPLLAWIGAVLATEPAALRVWWHEMIDRLGGTSPDLHPEPWWFFLPIFLVGLFPATLMLSIPGINFSWRTTWAALRRGEETALWALAVVVPLVAFSLIKGKLPSYLLPLAPPLAILTGRMLLGWIDGLHDAPAPGYRPPEVVKAVAFTCVALFLASAALVWSPAWLVAATIRRLHRDPDSLAWELGAVRQWVWLPLAVLPAVIAAVRLSWIWKKRPWSRTAGLASVWLFMSLAWLVATELEDAVRAPRGNSQMIAAIASSTGVRSPRLVTFGFRDESLEFYTQAPAPRVDRTNLLDAAAYDPERLFVVADADDWQRLNSHEPKLAQRFTPVLEWTGGPHVDRALILRFKK